MDPLAVSLGHAGGARTRCAPARAHDRRGGRLPLLPPERPVSRQRLRLSDEGGGGRVASRDPLELRRERDDRARAHRRRRESPPCASRWRRRCANRPPSLTEAEPSGKTDKRRIRPELWPQPRIRRRRHSRRPVRARRCRASRGAGVLLRTSSSRGKFIDVVAEVMDRRMGDGPAHRRARRGRAPAQRRHQRRDQAAWRRSIPVACSARRSARTPSPGWRRPRPRRPIPPGRRVHVPRLHRGSPPTRCSTRSARPGTCSAAISPVPLVLRTKVAMGTGYGSQHFMDPAGIFATNPGWRIMAAVDPVRLRRPDEHRARLRRPGADARARRPLRRRGRSRRSTTSITIPFGKAKPCAARARRHGAHLSLDGRASLEGDRATGSRRRS